MKTILGYLRPHAPRVAVGVTVKFSAAVLELLLPLLLAHIIDGCVPARDLPGVFRAGGWMLVMAFGAALCNITANRMAAWVSMDVTRQLRRDLYRRTLFLSQAQMDRFSVSSIVSRLTNDTYNVHQMFDKIQRGGIRAPMLVLGGMVLTFLQAPPLALVQLAVCSATFFAICWVTRRGIPRYARAQEAVDTVVRIIRENAAGVRVVKALSCQGRERDRFAAASQAAKEAEETAGSVMAAANPLSDFLLNLGLVLVVLAGAALVNRGWMSSGQIVAFLSYFTIIQTATLGLAKLFVKYSKGVASARRIEEVLLAPEDQQVRPGVDRRNGTQGVIVAHGDLGDGHGVVLVDDRQSPQLQQPGHGVMEILPALGVFHIGPGEEDLRYRVVVFRKQLIIYIHQLALAHSGQSLLGGDVGGLFCQVQLPHPHGDGSRGHQHQLMPRILQVAHDLAQQLHPPDIQLPRGMGQGGGAQLDDNPHMVHPFGMIMHSIPHSHRNWNRHLLQYLLYYRHIFSSFAS